MAALLAMPGVEIVTEPSDEHLAELYSKARALVYPSRMEGFALPVAEAMACGCPVIASRLPEIQEWAEDGPVYVAPGSVEELAQAILAISDPQLRGTMAARGRELAGSLDWDQSGAAVAEALEEAIAERSGA
jgi:glycosyltransferase involved in cell wall biosynthesis